MTQPIDDSARAAKTEGCTRREVLTRDDVMEGVPELVDEVQIEATFPDGRKLVTLHRPIQ